MPVRELSIQVSIVLLLKLLLEPCPACTDRLRIVLDATFIDESLSNFFLEVFRILHADDDLILRVKISGDLLRKCWASSLGLEAFVGIIAIRNRNNFVILVMVSSM